MANITFDVKQNIKILSQNEKGYTKELNLVSWNGKQEKLDIREWYPEHERCSKGITLTDEEGRNLMDALVNYYMYRSK